MERSHLGMMAVAAIAGIAAGVVMFWTPGPGSEPPPAPAQTTTKARAQPAPAQDAPIPERPEPPKLDRRPSQLPPGQVDPVEAVARVDPDALARWQEEEPVALHAARDAERWEAVAEQLGQAGQSQLAIEARTIGLRLQRAMAPVHEDEVRAMLIEEIGLLRKTTRLARDVLEDDALLAELQDIEQGAQHALQGAPPPEP